MDSTISAFDRVELTTTHEDGSARVDVLSPEGFLALPLSIRIQSVLERTAVFFRGNEPVDAALALAKLREQRARVG